MRQLDRQPRVEIAQKRIALGKLLKDFDRVKSSFSAIALECNTITVTSNSEYSSNIRTGVGLGQVSEIEGNEYKQQLQQQQHHLIQTLQGNDVDEAITRERERELKKIQQDMIMVNEMFRLVLS